MRSREEFAWVGGSYCQRRPSTLRIDELRQGSGLWLMGSARNAISGEIRYLFYFRSLAFLTSLDALAMVSASSDPLSRMISERLFFAAMNS